MADDAYDHDMFHGVPLDLATIAALKQAEEQLGYMLTITQGIGDAGASAESHTKGRAVDLVPWDWKRKVKVLKRIGFAVWHREPLPGVWGEHIHAVLILDRIDNERGIHPVAFRQIGSFLRGHDGLKHDDLDKNPFRVEPQPVFTFPPPVAAQQPKQTAVSRSRDRLAEAHGLLLQAAALLDDADPERVKARKQRDHIRKGAAFVEFILGEMPDR